MQNKSDRWIAKAKEVTLSRRDLLFLLDRQLWPIVGYGMSSNTLYWIKIIECLKNQWWELIPMEVVIHTALADVRQKSR